MTLTRTDASAVSRVRAVPAADPAVAAAHFARLLSLETDPSDLAADLAARADGIVVVDVRAPDAYAAGHVPGALSLPHARIDESSTAALPRDAVLVVYCWATGCNGADKGAARLAGLGFRVKKLVGGYDHWRHEGHALERSDR